MKRVVLIEEASDDLRDAKLFYNMIDPGVGDYCADSLLSDIERLGMFHGYHSMHFDCHRALAVRFPFGIYYIDEQDEIKVVAVLDLRRDPSWIRSELGRRSD
ncbi:MAG: hypothetical protein WCD79_01140 [Chthoniobacteraceae bacterium]